MVSTQFSDEQSVAVSGTNIQLEHSPVTIIEMAVIFPKAKSLQEYWENIIHIEYPTA